jgi:hypothetical protein
MARIELEHASKGWRLDKRTLSHLPPRLITGAYIVNAGVSKLAAGQETAKGLHGMATAAYPFLGKLDAQTFTRLLGAGELTLGGLVAAANRSHGPGRNRARGLLRRAPRPVPAHPGDASQRQPAADRPGHPAGQGCLAAGHGPVLRARCGPEPRRRQRLTLHPGAQAMQVSIPGVRRGVPQPPREVVSAARELPSTRSSTGTRPRDGSPATRPTTRGNPTWPSSSRPSLHTPAGARWWWWWCGCGPASADPAGAAAHAEGRRRRGIDRARWILQRLAGGRPPAP